MHICICVYMCMGVIFVCLSGLLRQGASLCELLYKTPYGQAFVSGPGAKGKPLLATQMWSKLL